MDFRTDDFIGLFEEAQQAVPGAGLVDPEGVVRLDDAGVDVAMDISAPVLTLYASAGHATALQEIARLAALAGGQTRVSGR